MHANVYKLQNLQTDRSVCVCVSVSACRSLLLPDLSARNFQVGFSSESFNVAKIPMRASVCVCVCVGVWVSVCLCVCLHGRQTYIFTGQIMSRIGFLVWSWSDLPLQRQGFFLDKTIYLSIALHDFTHHRFIDYNFFGVCWSNFISSWSVKRWTW